MKLYIKKHIYLATKCSLSGLEEITVLLFAYRIHFLYRNHYRIMY